MRNPKNYIEPHRVHLRVGNTTLNALLLFATFGAALWGNACASSSPKSQLSPQLSASPAQVAFGNVSVGSKGLENISVSNTGSANLTVSQATVSGSGFSMSGLQPPLTVAPGQSTAFTVSFAPTAANSATGSLTLVSNAPNSLTTISLSATGVAASSQQISVVPTSASFGSVTVGTTNTQTMTLSNPGSANLNVSQATVSGSGFGLSGLTLPLTVAPGKSAAFTVSFTPTAASSASGSLSLVSNAPTSPTTIPLSGSGAAVSVQLTASLTSLNYGNVNLGSTSSKTVTLTNTGNSSVSISQLSVSGAGFTASGLTAPLSLTAGQSTTFSVNFAPTAAGAVSGSVSVASNATNSPTLIALTGSGVQSTSVMGVTISPTNPSVQAGQTIQFTDTIQGTTTNTSVTWAASAGSITSSGLFTAPSSAGTATVMATSNADASKQASTTVTVTDPSAGPQLYVATTGNDANSGTSTSAPWRTIQKAMNSATAGSTVNVMAGTYNERLTVGVSGTTGNYITFQPYNFSVPAGGCGGYTGTPCGGDQVILDYAYLGTVSDGVPYLAINGKSYIRIQGLTFQNYQVRGAMQRGVEIYGASSYVEFKYNRVLNIQNNGAWDGTNALLDFWTEPPAHDVWIYGNEIAGIVSNYGETMTTVASGVTIENNWIHDTDAIAINIGQNSSNTIVRGNLLEWIAKKHDGSIWYNNPANAIYVNGGNTATIERNIVRDSEYAYAVVTEPGYPASHDVAIRNNLAYRDGQAGLMLGNWYSSTDGSNVYNITVTNNTVYSCSYGFIIRPYVSASIVWENNIFANNGTTYVNTLNWNPGTAGYNLYFGGGTGPGTNNLTSDPLFVSASTGNFSLQSTSPAINAGDPNSSTTIVGTVDFAGNPRIQGGRIDIGALEQ